MPTPKAVAGEIDIEVDRQDLHLEHVARFRLGDGNRAGQDVAAGSLVRHFLVDGVGVQAGISSRLTPRLIISSGEPQVDSVCMRTVSPERTVSAGFDMPE